MLNLNDENRNKIASTTTDGSGNFDFQNLEEGSLYFVQIDPSNGKVPDNAKLFIKDPESGAMMPVAKLANGSFAFQTLPYMTPEELKAMEVEDETPIPAGVNASTKHPDVEGNLKYGSAAATGVLVNLADKDQNKIGTAITDESGDFTFMNLNAGSKYFVMIDPANGSVPADAQLFIKDSKTGKMIPVSKMSDGSFAFETLPYMSLEELKTMEEKDDVVAATPAQKTEASKETPTKAAEAPKEVAAKKTMPPAYKTEVKEIDGEKYIIHEVKEGETMFDVSLIYNLRFDVVQSANPEMGDLIFAGDRIKLPVPAEVMFYQEFFDYNKVEIRADASDYKNFLLQVEKVVQEKGKATLMIESSSSKVPSSSSDNKALSLKRAENAKNAIVKSMSEKSIGADKLNFADMSTLVRGPEYQNDAKENRATYKSYQYVKVIVK